MPIHIPGTTCHVICLHGFAPRNPVQWREAYDFMVRCFERLGIRPDHVTLEDVPGMSNQTRWLDGWKASRAPEDFPTPSSLVLGANVLGKVNLPGRLNTRAQAMILMGIGSPLYFPDGRPCSDDGGTFIFYCDAAFNRDALRHFNAIAQDAWACGGFQYGYGLTYGLGREMGPTGFLYGNPGRYLSASENAQRRQWADFRMQTPEARIYESWVKGRVSEEIPDGLSYAQRLRDVFELNHLLRSHLALRVGDVGLLEWIGGDERRGRIHALADGLWCWEIKKSLLADVRRALDSEGLLVAPGNR